jgi:pyochelin biosynthesis protein PchG
MNDTSQRRLRVVVCGATFGQFYLAAFGAANFPFELVGLMSTGSANSMRVAKRYGVPLFTDVNQVPQATDLACVVVRSGAMGGKGTELAQQFLGRGVHVLQEHPVHHDELAQCLAIAARHDVTYQLNPFYSHLEPVRQFVSAARRLLEREEALFVDAACAVQVAYPLLDILGQALGGVSPWQLRRPIPLVNSVDADRTAVFSSIEGFVGGVPLTLRVQNQIDAADPDNNLHLLHRIVVGTASGNLSLVNTHGPLIWSPKLHVAAAIKDFLDLDSPQARALDAASSVMLGSGSSPSFRCILRDLWPQAAERAMREIRDAILKGTGSRRSGQYHLGLCRFWQNLTSHLGYPEQTTASAPRHLDVRELQAAAAAAGAWS